MPPPPAYNRSFSFSNFQAQNPSAALPGSSLEQELNNVKATLDAILTNLKLVQRDDGAIANASVGLDQLSAQVPEVSMRRWCGRPEHCPPVAAAPRGMRGQPINLRRISRLLYRPCSRSSRYRPERKLQQCSRL